MYIEGMKKRKKVLPPSQEMLVPDGLPEFFDERALLIATGKQDAKFYLVHDGILKSVDSFIVKTPKYSDREGHFKTRMRDKVIRSGAVYENRKGKVITDFTKDLTRRFAKIVKKHHPEKLYIYSPLQMHLYIREALPKAWREKITMEIAGNHYKTHPLILLKKISQRSASRRVEPTTETEQKILQRRIRHSTATKPMKRYF
jgi:hypothetical protein